MQTIFLRFVASWSNLPYLCPLSCFYQNNFKKINNNQDCWRVRETHVWVLNWRNIFSGASCWSSAAWNSSVLSYSRPSAFKPVSPATESVVKRLLQRGKRMQGRPFNRQMQNAVWSAYQFCVLENNVWKAKGRHVIALNETLYVTRKTVYH